MLEAVLLSITPSYLQSLRGVQPKLYTRLAFLKSDIDRPLAAILSFNTVAHTIGAAGAGAEAQKLFGSEALAIFSALLTIAILVLSEIIPKSIGASYWKNLVPLTSKILPILIYLSLPLVWMSEFLTKIFKSGHAPQVSREEISAVADIGLHDGVIEKAEHQFLKNLMLFKGIKVSKVMTPKHEVYGLHVGSSIEEAFKKDNDNDYSRIPLFGVDQDDLRGYILRAQMLKAKAEGLSASLGELSKPMLIVNDRLTVNKLFFKLLERREHIAAVVTEGGQFSGIVTMEDLIETMLGLEIMDELDTQEESVKEALKSRLSKRPVYNDSHLISGDAKPKNST